MMPVVFKNKLLDSKMGACGSGLMTNGNPAASWQAGRSRVLVPTNGAFRCPVAMVAGVLPIHAWKYMYLYLSMCRGMDGWTYTVEMHMGLEPCIGFPQSALARARDL
ncbi:hypothetical protein TWF106_004578 [Orbilia oligospora]|uniref:Uncharacterized protein n=1 Tax=Orbilia oligospora TaxID=2813651 RepID=A0A7C8UHH7_ORBOL|nr:hypothetical protein TWF106_004578 [Orbilia oligospora]